MFQTIPIAARYFILATLLLSGQVFAAARLEPLTVGYSNITATYAPLWLAVEEHVGVKVGLDMLSLQYPQAKQTDATQIIDRHL